MPLTDTAALDLLEQRIALARIVERAWECVKDGDDYTSGHIEADMTNAGLLEPWSATAEDVAKDPDLEVGDSLLRLTALGRAALGRE